MPDKLESGKDHSHWKIVRMDDYTDIPGDIVEADVAKGECTTTVKGETKSYNLGENGFRVLAKTRLERDRDNAAKPASMDDYYIVERDDDGVIITEKIYSDSMGDCG